MKTLNEIFTAERIAKFAMVYAKTANAAPEIAEMAAKSEAVLLYNLMKKEQELVETTAITIYFDIALKGVSIDPTAKLAFIDVRKSKDKDTDQWFKSFYLQIQTEGKMQMLANRGIKADPVSCNLIYQNDKYKVGLNGKGQIALIEYEKTFVNKGQPIFAYIVFATKSDYVPFLFDFDQLKRLKTMARSKNANNSLYGSDSDASSVDPEFWITKAIKHGLTRLLHQGKESDDDDTETDAVNDSEGQPVQVVQKPEKTPQGITVNTSRAELPSVSDDDELF